MKLFDNLAVPAGDKLASHTWGARPVQLLTGWHFYKRLPDSSGYDWDAGPDDEVMKRNISKTVQEDPFRLYVCNLEQAKLADDQPLHIVLRDLERIQRALWFVAEEVQDLEFGIYRILPRRDYFAHRGDEEHNLRWRFNNDLRSIYLTPSVLLPSLYNWYADTTEWKAFAAHNIAEAGRLRPHGTKYVYLSPQFAGKEKYGELLPLDVWKDQLEFIYSEQYQKGLISGAVLYSWGKSWEELEPYALAARDIFKTEKEIPKLEAIEAVKRMSIDTERKRRLIEELEI